MERCVWVIYKYILNKRLSILEFWYPRVGWSQERGREGPGTNPLRLLRDVTLFEKVKIMLYLVQIME